MSNQCQGLDVTRGMLQGDYIAPLVTCKVKTELAQLRRECLVSEQHNSVDLIFECRPGFRKKKMKWTTTKRGALGSSNATEKNLGL